MSEKIEKGTNERLFTQAELSKLINKRLSRERRNNAALSNVYKLLKVLAEKKIINASSYAEAAQELQNKLMLLCNDENMKTDDRKVGKSGEVAEEIKIISELYETSETDEDSERAEEIIPVDITETVKRGDVEPDSVNTSESFADEIYTSDCELCKEEKASFEEKKPEAYPLSEISELFERFPENRAWKIITSHEFSDFCRGRVGGLCELYDCFCKHFGKLSSLFDGEEKTESEHLSEGTYNNISPRNIISEYSSTGFSGRSASPSSDDGANLSPLQRKIAKSAGISYREYASMLREIPQYSKSDKRTLTKIRI